MLTSWRRPLVLLALTLPLAGCDHVENAYRIAIAIAQIWQKPAAPLIVRDFAAEDLGLPDPVHQSLDDWYGEPLPSLLAKVRVDVARAFFAGEFAAVDAALSAAHAAYVRGETPIDNTDRLLSILEDSKLAGSQRCEQWTRAMPSSYAAHYACGLIWQQGAWMARTEERASRVSATQFALMDARLMRSNRLLERAITLDPKPVQALTALADNQFLQSRRAQAEATLERALALMPAHAAAYEVAARYAHRNWGGSDEKVAAVLQRAQRAEVHPDTVAYIRDHRMAQPWDTATPGAEKTYWEKALIEHASYWRLRDLARYHAGLENWRDALPLLDRAAQAYPEMANNHYWKGRAHEALSQSQAAFDSYRLAAAMGDEDAINHLIHAYLRGGLGLPRDLQAVVRLCRHAAGIGSPSGANCIGSGHWDASVPELPRDAAQSLAWHAMAARGGNWNSQHDVGWLLMSRKFTVVGASPADAHAAGVFWLQRSAEQGHEFAIKKLRDADIALDSAPRHQSD